MNIPSGKQMLSPLPPPEAVHDSICYEQLEKAYRDVVVGNGYPSLGYMSTEARDYYFGYTGYAQTSTPSPNITWHGIPIQASQYWPKDTIGMYTWNTTVQTPRLNRIITDLSDLDGA